MCVCVCVCVFLFFPWGGFLGEGGGTVEGVCRELGGLNFFFRGRNSHQKNLQERKRHININIFSGHCPGGAGLLTGFAGVQHLCAVCGTQGT